jgi:threonine aldolase
MIDLRSDTVTKPDVPMLKAMMEAEVGDDVFGEDPTINALEKKAAKMFGHEAGIFCPSGTMTNQIAIQVHTRPGDEVICHALSHVYNYEGGGIARNALASTRLVHNETATMTPEEIASLMHTDKDWLARTSLVVAEDTSNRGGGKCYESHQLEALSAFCKERGLGFHLDGARAFNALVKKGHDFAEYGSLFDSVSLCLSKGLGSPVGSVLLGSHDFIREARRVRKVMGGGMRQGGYLAAACIYALDHNIQRLSEDHKKASRLAMALEELKAVKKVIIPETNIILFDIDPKKGIEYYLNLFEQDGLLAVPFGENRIRMVTHKDVNQIQVDTAIQILQKACGRE